MTSLVILTCVLSAAGGHKLSARGCRASIEGHRGILEVKFRPDVEVHEIFLEAKISGSRGSRGAPDEKYLAPEFIELFPENASRIFLSLSPLTQHLRWHCANHATATAHDAEYAGAEST